MEQRLTTIVVSRDVSAANYCDRRHLVHLIGGKKLNKLCLGSRYTVCMQARTLYAINGKSSSNNSSGKAAIEQQSRVG